MAAACGAASARSGAGAGDAPLLPTGMELRRHPGGGGQGDAHIRRPQRGRRTAGHRGGDGHLRLYGALILAQTRPAGEETPITVTFDPRNRPGSFSKELSVFSSRRERLARLRITGNVVARELSLEEEYPFDFGEGLRLDGNFHSFAYLYRGQEAATQFEAVNTTDEPMTLRLEPATADGFLTFTGPRELAPGERFRIGISCLVPTDSPRYGTVREEVALLVNGRRAGRTLTLHGIAVDPPQTEGPAPRMQCGETIIRFGTQRRSAGSRTQPLRIANTGTRTLVVRAVESQPGIGCSLRPGERVAPGKTLEATVTLDPGSLDYGAVSKRLLIVTNDPEHPSRTLRVTAIIED